MLWVQREQQCMGARPAQCSLPGAAFERVLTRLDEGLARARFLPLRCTPRTVCVCACARVGSRPVSFRALPACQACVAQVRAEAVHSEPNRPA